ncbi:MAG: threonine/serine dehydratase [Acidobacteriota bacterium]
MTSETDDNASDVNAPDVNAPDVPSLGEIREARQLLGERIRTTPTWRWQGRDIAEVAGEGTEVFLKLELFQYAGTFKPRGALLNTLALDEAARARGVTAVSAGNHAIAVGYAARAVGTTAKVVMLASANPARVQACADYGAEVVPMPDVHQAFDEVYRIEREEGRAFIHPFEGRRTALGTATVGLELSDQVAGLDAVIVPIGGGGLCAGVAMAIKLAQPDCQVYGVEPEGADSMHRSFAAGEPQSIDKVRTFADSLGAPYAAPYSFGLCQRFVDDLVKVSDDEMRHSMRLLFRGMKLAVEPAGAAATAALCGPLRERLEGKRVGVIVCGTNIDTQTFHQQIAD